MENISNLNLNQNQDQLYWPSMFEIQRTGFPVFLTVLTQNIYRTHVLERKSHRDTQPKPGQGG